MVKVADKLYGGNIEFSKKIGVTVNFTVELALL